MNMNIKDHFIRFKIEDLEEELTISEVKASRIPEIIRLHKSSLGEGPYYCICHGNPAFRILEKREKYSYQVPEDLRTIYENRLKRCYRPGTGKTSYFLKTTLVEFSGEYFPVIKQTIEPKTAQDFAYLEEYQKYYISGESIRSIFSNGKIKIGE